MVGLNLDIISFSNTISTPLSSTCSQKLVCQLFNTNEMAWDYCSVAEIEVVERPFN